MSSVSCAGFDAKAGAFYTPETIAHALAQWVVRTGTERLLEPSVGDGALVWAVLKTTSRTAGHNGIAACQLYETMRARSQAYRSRQLLRDLATFAGLCRKLTLDFGCVDDLENGPPLQEQCLLEHHTDVATGHECSFLRTDPDLALVGLMKIGEDFS